MAGPTRMGSEKPKRLAAEGSMARWAWVSLWIFAGIFILGVKWWLIDMLGVNVPFLDQWDAEGRNLYAAWQTGELTFSSLIASHNEHRIITGRLWHLLWFLLNEQTWNVRLQMQVNAIVHTTAVLLVTAAACAHGGRRVSVASLPILLVGLAVGAVPSAWFNLFGGFQVQFYFALLFQIVAMLLWLANAPLSMKWWLGTAAYLVAMNSVATGSLVGFAVVPVLLVHRYRQMPSRKDWLAVATILGMGVIASVLTVSVSVVSLRAGAPTEFLSTLLKSLSYPFMNIRWPAFLLWFPFGVHVALWFRRGRETSAWDDRLVCLGLWVMAMAAATSYGRGADGRGPLVHYMDHLAPGLLVNMGCLVRVGLLWHRRGIGIKMAHGVGFSLWAYVALVGYSQAAGNSNGWVRGPKFRHFQTNTMARNLHHYLVTGDVSHLTDHGAVPYFTNPKHQQKLADRAEIRAILPPNLTKTLKFKVLGMGGKAKLPVIDEENYATNYRTMGLVHREGRDEKGHLVVRFRLPDERRHVAFKVQSQGAADGDVTLEVRSGGIEQQLVLSDADTVGAIETRYLSLAGDVVDFKVVDHGEVPGGEVLFTAPHVVGRLRFGSEWLLKRGLMMIYISVAGLMLAFSVVISGARGREPAG